MMDEIHIKPYFDYKGGNIVGSAHNSVVAATTAHVFKQHIIKLQRCCAYSSSKTFRGYNRS
jgi:hypothetical protein